VQLSLREKQSFYGHLAQFLRAGVAFPGAVDKLALTSRGGQRRTLHRLRELLGTGKTISEAFGALRPAVTEMEWSALKALERSGRMDRGLQHLADYFGAMENARRETLRRSAYPLVVLHFGVLVANLRILLSEGVAPYLWRTGFVLFVLYGVLAIVAMLLPLLRDAGAKSPMVDWLLHRVPFAGKIRRSFALARFCSTYDMQLEAGVNVMDSLEAAGLASRSGLIRGAVAQAVPGIRMGSQVGTQLAQSVAFPESFTRTVIVAEETGELDKALGRLTSQYQGDALEALTAFSEWVPRLVYGAVAVYVAWNVIQFWIGYMHEVSQIGAT
jgi:type II secretory pathway component PulF